MKVYEAVLDQLRGSGVRHFAGMVEANEEALLEKMERGYHALDVMESHLASNEFFVADQYTIADIGLYAYTHVAHEGGFDLAGYGSVSAWLDRIAVQPGHVQITDEL